MKSDKWPAQNAYEDLRAAGAGRIVTANTIAHASNAIDLGDAIGEKVRSLAFPEQTAAS